MREHVRVTEGRATAVWQSLNEVEQITLYAAFDEIHLGGVLLLIAASGDPGDQEAVLPQVSSAAVRLVRDGLVEMFEEPMGSGDAAFVASLDAAELLADHSFWLGSNPARNSIFSLTATALGRDVVRAGMRLRWKTELQ
jgi:hypothetical protein